MHDADRDEKAYSCTRYAMEQVVDIIDNFYGIRSDKCIYGLIS